MRERPELPVAGHCQLSSGMVICCCPRPMAILDRTPPSTKAQVAQPASPHVIRSGRREVRPGCVTTPALRKRSYNETG